MSYSGLQPPGWYHAAGDPPDSQRWWDGTQWVGGPAASGYVDPFLSPPQSSMYRPPMYAPMRMDPRPLAGFWPRFAAYLIDGLLVGLWAGALLVIGVIIVPVETQICNDLNSRPYLCDQPTGTGWFIILTLFVVAVLGAAAYHVLPVAKTGQTLGKRGLGIAVVDQWTGEPIRFGRSLGRFAGAWFISGSCGLGYLWAAWDKDKQTWHDKMVTSVVVQVGDNYAWPPSAATGEGPYR